jgi:urease accessory protein
VHARAVVRAVVRRGRTVLDELRSEAPLGLFPGLDPDPGSAQVWLVGSAGGPLGGDDIELAVEVGEDADLVVGSVAASLALAGTAPSIVRVHVVIGPRGRLTWTPEPLIVTGRADHRVEVHIAAAADAHVWWRDELVLGRGDERTGRCTLIHRADLGGVPWLRHELGVGTPGWDGGAVLGPHRRIGSVLTTEDIADPPVVADPPVPPDPPEAAQRSPDVGGSTARLSLDAGGSLTVALAPDRRALDGLLPTRPAADRLLPTRPAPDRLLPTRPDRLLPTHPAPVPRRPHVAHPHR